MIIRSLPGSSRSRHQLPADPIHRLITFQVQQDWFALPIQVAQKVVPPQPIYGENPELGIGLALVQGRKIPTLDLRAFLFQVGSSPALLPAAEGGFNSPVVPRLTSQQHILIIQPPQFEAIGLLIQGQPVLRRVPESAFSAISPVYLIMNNLRCVDTVIALSDDMPPIFLLNLKQLLPEVTPVLAPAQPRSLTAPSSL